MDSTTRAWVKEWEKKAAHLEVPTKLAKISMALLTHSLRLYNQGSRTPCLPARAGGRPITPRCKSSQLVSSSLQQQLPETWSRAQRELVGGTLDLGSLDVSSTRRAELVQEVRHRAEAGVLYVSNFGVDPVLEAQVRDLARTFFSQPAEDKARVRAGVDDSQLLTSMVLPAVEAPDNVWFLQNARGYARKFSTSVPDSTTLTELEGSHPGPVGFRELFRSVAYPESEREGNVWPDSALPGFKHAAEKYSAQVQRAVEFLVGLLVEGLGLPASYLWEEYQDDIITNMVMLNFPPQELPAGHLAAPALPSHTDANLLNLSVFDVAGLQFFRRGSWVTAPAFLGSALVSLGEAMETVSNGKYRAACHRVVSGPRSRLSMVTSLQFGASTVLAPASQLIDEENPARYRSRLQIERISNREHLWKRERSKASIMLDPASHLDPMSEVYKLGRQDFINGKPLQDWGATV